MAKKAATVKQEAGKLEAGKLEGSSLGAAGFWRARYQLPRGRRGGDVLSLPARFSSRTAAATALDELAAVGFVPVGVQWQPRAEPKPGRRLLVRHPDSVAGRRGPDRGGD